MCAKVDQFLPVRYQFDSNQHVNSVRIATFQSANFGPLLFAFYCPLFFLRKNKVSKNVQAKTYAKSSSYVCWRCAKPNHSPDVCRFKEAVCHGCKQKGHIIRACKQSTHDLLIEVKLNAFSLAKVVTPFLTVYQTDLPMIPLLAGDLHTMLK